MLFLDRQSGLHQLHPLTKLSVSGFAFVAAASLADLRLVLVLYLGLFVIALWGRVGLAYLRNTARAIWPFAVSLLLIQGLFAPGSTVLARVGPLAFKLEGVELAARFTGRLLGWFGAGLLLMISTRPDRLMIALTDIGLPRSLGYMVLTSLQIIPRFQSKATEILEAQRSRGLQTEGSLRKRARGLLPLVMPLILGSLAELELRAIALEARAFTHPGAKTSLIELTDSLLQRSIRWALLLSAIGLLALRITGT